MQVVSDSEDLLLVPLGDLVALGGLEEAERTEALRAEPYMVRLRSAIAKSVGRDDGAWALLLEYLTEKGQHEIVARLKST